MMRNSGEKETRTSVVIPNYNGARLLKSCLNSILRNTDIDDLEVIVVDNGSHDESIDVIDRVCGKFRTYFLISNEENLGVTRALNQGIEQASGKYLAILNNDTMVQDNWLNPLIRVLDLNPDVGGVQPKMLKMNDTFRIDSTGCLVDKHGCPMERGSHFGGNEFDKGQYDKTDEIFSAGCPASVFRKEVVIRTGMYDSEFFTGCEDLDLCWRIRLMGYKILYVPESKVFHLRSSTILRSDLARKTWFHFRKNHMATLFKNYELANLVSELPAAVSIILIHGLKDILLSRDPMMSLVSIKALFWNVAHARYLSRQRAFVQSEVRKVGDAQIRSQMNDRCLLIAQLGRFLKLGDVIK